ncbi:F0F1 ATP synthase subunit delta [Rhodoferax antarcticus]|uniref:ATP synthase subunit delta n=1 Tax=Rhodoferax antarcticus ANT.BR TaxID=1111071 RepID=A0A1Q8YFP2_9BURK|nr:F0F1 ATP synthase subunit delta [Rhodoferax antarcticus]APW45400.1 F0F1 ATP synthase subunit delta [Rhodoferax antarcticus]MCW2312749.1 F-type H+-transporting ATPase subunit delta [Rhodoferax antarcticus]OLP06823.1 ATP synthase F1, delta subunit [Rhodoferax antarcticus ANT.BR]
MAELATIARPYAEALYKACGADAKTVLGWLDELACVAAEPQLLQFADSPKTTSEQTYGVISDVMKTALDAHAQNFLRMVIDNNRLSFLPEIAAQFRSLANAQSGSSDAVIFSAFPIEGTALADTAKVLEQRFGRKLNVLVALQPELIGGIRVVIGDEVLDTSVKARLEQMKMALSA